MSARDLMTPNRAFLQTLNNLNRRLMAAQRRARFPGAVHSEYEPGPDTLGVGTIITPVATDILTLTLEKGRWFLYGGTVITGNPAGTDSFEFGLYIASASLPYPTAGATDFATTSTDVSRPLAVVATTTVTTPTSTFTLLADVGVGISGTAEANDSYLIGVPA